jgi:hypothetical protein
MLIERAQVRPGASPRLPAPARPEAKGRQRSSVKPSLGSPPWLRRDEEAVGSRRAPPPLRATPGSPVDERAAEAFSAPGRAGDAAVAAALGAAGGAGLRGRRARGRGRRRGRAGRAARSRRGRRLRRTPRCAPAAAARLGPACRRPADEAARGPAPGCARPAWHAQQRAHGARPSRRAGSTRARRGAARGPAGGGRRGDQQRRGRLPGQREERAHGQRARPRRPPRRGPRGGGRGRHARLGAAQRRRCAGSPFAPFAARPPEDWVGAVGPGPARRLLSGRALS